MVGVFTVGFGSVCLKRKELVWLGDLSVKGRDGITE